MAHLPGKYQLTGNENLILFIKKSGFPEETAKRLDQLRPILTVSVDENKVQLKTEDSERTMINDLVLGQEIIEIHNPLGIKTRMEAPDLSVDDACPLAMMHRAVAVAPAEVEGTEAMEFGCNCLQEYSFCRMLFSICEFNLDQ
ncbi:hypothetical protein JTB14_021335 [Gonioctena quinquepunctata]|nr:hypothetical protein JTB14_021335 [Gonioctena quinquepunctata]